MHKAHSRAHCHFIFISAYMRPETIYTRVYDKETENGVRYWRELCSLTKTQPKHILYNAIYGTVKCLYIRIGIQ